MLGKTHVVGGAVFSLGGYLYLKQTGNLLPSDVLNPVLQFTIIYSAGLYGSRFPDIDHSEHSPLKDPMSVLLHKALHLFNGWYNTLDKTLSGKEKRVSINYKLAKLLSCRHRSWQTHSEITLFCVYLISILPVILSSVFYGIIDSHVLKLMTTGLTLGIVSHLLLDALTVEGFVLAFGEFINIFKGKQVMIENIRFVPKTKYRDRVSGKDQYVFGTGTKYEDTVRFVLNIVQFLLAGLVVLSFFGYSIYF